MTNSAQWGRVGEKFRSGKMQTKLYAVLVKLWIFLLIFHFLGQFWHCLDIFDNLMVIFFS